MTKVYYVGKKFSILTWSLKYHDIGVNIMHLGNNITRHPALLVTPCSVMHIHQKHIIAGMVVMGMKIYVYLITFPPPIIIIHSNIIIG